MSSKKRTCFVCRENYSYCPNCSNDAGKPTWMFVFCSELCHDVYDILNNRSFEYINDLEAKKLLLKLDLDKKEFSPELKEEIDKILKTKEPETKEPEAVKTDEVKTDEVKAPTKVTKGFSRKTK